MKKTILAVSLLALSSLSFAQNVQKVESQLNKLYPNLGVVSVEYVPEVKLYEVKIKDNPSLSYTNENIDFFLINGQIVDPRTKINLSEDRILVNGQKIFKKLPFDKAIKVKHGKGERAIAVFTDPDCPFCKNLDKELSSKLNSDSNVTIYYFMNPLNIPGHEQAPLKAAKVWCSPDKAKAWYDFMVSGIIPANDGNCKNPVAETKKLATELGFNSTPTVVFDNGIIINQQFNVDQLKKLLALRKP